MKNIYLKRVIKKYIKTFFIGVFPLLTQTLLIAQIQYPGNQGDIIGTSNSRMVVTVEETDEHVILHVMAIGEILADAFGFNIVYQPNSLVLTDNTFAYDIPLGLDPIDLGSRVISIAPSFSSVYSTFRTQVMNHQEVQNGATAGMRYINTTVGTSNINVNAALNIEAGKMIPVYTIYFRKQVPGTPLETTDIGFYYNQTIPRTYSSWAFRGVSITYGAASSSDFHYPNPDLFIYRSPSSVTTHPANNTGATFASLNGHFSRGHFAPTNNMIVSGRNSATTTGKLNYDTIPKYGFIYSIADVDIYTNDLSNKLVINNIEYDFPSSAEIAAGSFIRDGNIFHIILRDNSVSDQEKNYVENITGLNENGTYYAWAVIQYSFETSGIYAKVGERESFIATSDCNTPEAPIAQANQSFCGNGTIADLVAFTDPGIDLVWYDNNNLMLDLSDALTDGAIYYIRASDDGCQSQPVAVEVSLNNGLNAPTATSPQIFCTGSRISDILVSGIGLKWYDAPTGDNLLDDDEILINERIYYVAQSDAICESNTRTAVKVIISDYIPVTPPVIASPQYLCTDAKIEDIATDGSNIIWYDENNNILPINTQLSTGTTYYAVKNTGTCESTDRTSVLVYIGDNLVEPPVIASPQHFCPGAVLSNIAVSGNQIIWYASQTGDTQLSSNTVLSDNTTYYAARRAGDCESTTRTPVVISIDYAPEVIADTNQELCEGNTISDIIVTGSGIKWYSSPDSDVELDISTLLVNGTTYYAVQSDGDCESNIRTGITININYLDSPVATSPQEFCNAATIADIQIEGGEIVWYDNSTSENRLDPTTPLVDGHTYYAAKVNGICESNSRRAITVFIKPLPEITNLQNFVFCDGEIVNEFTFEGTISEETSFYWRRVIGQDLGLPQAYGINTIPSFTAENSGIYPLIDVYEVEYIHNVNACPQIIETFLITVNPTPVVAPVNDMVYCYGTQVEPYLFTGNIPEANYKWFRSGGNIIEGLPEEGYNIIPGFTALAETTPISANYKVTADYNYANMSCNNQDTIEFSITILPEISVNVNIEDQVICSSNALDEIIFTSNVENVTFRWIRTSGQIPGLAASGEGNILSQILYNEGNTVLSASYLVTPVYNSCEGHSKPFSITILPGNAMIQVPDLKLCEGENVAAFQLDNSYSWTNLDGIDIGLPMSGFGSLPAFTAKNTNDQTVFARYKITNKYIVNNIECESSSIMLITVYPAPEINMPYRHTACSGDNSVDISYTAHSGETLEYNIIFNPAAISAGFRDQVQFTELPSDKISIPIPENIYSGTYQGTININSEFCTNSYPFEIGFEKPFSIVKQPESITNICDENTIVVLSVVTDAENLEYQWYHNNIAIYGANSSNYSFEYSTDSDGEYYVEINNNCMTLSSTKVNVSQNIVSINIKWDNVLYVNDPDHIFSSFQWYKNGQPITTDGYAQYYGNEYGFNGTYFVRCYYSDGTFVETCPKTFETEKNTIISLYPNPVEASSNLIIEIQTDEFDIENAYLEIYDVAGKLVSRSIITGPITEINAPMSEGSYTARVITKTKQVITEHFVVGR